MEWMVEKITEIGFHELVNRPQESTRLNSVIKAASDALGEHLRRIDDHTLPHNSKALMRHWENVSEDAQRDSLYLLSEIQQIRNTYNPRLKRV
jgi:hypothetical protein